MNSFNEAFEDLIKDLYNAEKQLLKAMPKVAKKVQNEELRQGLEMHMQQTEGQVQRLEQIAQECGFKPTGKVCHAAKGLIEEMDEHLKEGKPGPLLDAVLVGGAQKFEHYEIAGYGTARAWAEQLGFDSAARLLQETLSEEEQMDEQCNKLAEGKLNREAMNAPVEEKPSRSSSRSNGNSSSSKSSSSGTKSRTKKAA